MDPLIAQEYEKYLQQFKKKTPLPEAPPAFSQPQMSPEQRALINKSGTTGQGITIKSYPDEQAEITRGNLESQRLGKERYLQDLGVYNKNKSQVEDYNQRANNYREEYFGDKTRKGHNVPMGTGYDPVSDRMGMPIIEEKPLPEFNKEPKIPVLPNLAQNEVKVDEKTAAPKPGSDPKKDIGKIGMYVWDQANNRYEEQPVNTTGIQQSKDLNMDAFAKDPEHFIGTASKTAHDYLADKTRQFMADGKFYDDNYQPLQNKNLIDAYEEYQLKSPRMAFIAKELNTNPDHLNKVGSSYDVELDNNIDKFIEKQMTKTKQFENGFNASNVKKSDAKRFYATLIKKSLITRLGSRAKLTTGLSFNDEYYSPFR